MVAFGGLVHALVAEGAQHSARCSEAQETGIYPHGPMPRVARGLRTAADRAGDRLSVSWAAARAEREAERFLRDQRERPTRPKESGASCGAIRARSVASCAAGAERPEAKP